MFCFGAFSFLLRLHRNPYAPSSGGKNPSKHLHKTFREPFQNSFSLTNSRLTPDKNKDDPKRDRPV